MSIKVVCTPYGPPARERLGEQIAALKDGDPLAAVTVVVPTNIAGLATRRALGARAQGIAAVNFLKLFDLADRLAGRRMADNHRRHPLSDLVIGATVREVLSDEPGLFRASAHHPATEQALVRSYRDLRDVPPEGHHDLAKQSKRAADVVRICQQVRDRLKGRWYDGQDLIEEAISMLRSDVGAVSVANVGPVIVYLPQRVTRAQGRLLASLALKTPMTVVAGLTGDDKADAAVVESIRRVGTEPVTPPSAAKPSSQHIISTASAEEEIRVAVREVLDAARAGIPLNRIAVLCGGGSPVIRQLHDQLDAADIPYNGPSGGTLADSLMGRGLLALLALKHHSFRRDDVFAFLSVASPTVPDHSADSHASQPAPVMAWERVSRHAGVARNPDQWAFRLEKFAAKRRADAAKAEDDPNATEHLPERLRREADHADSLAQFMAILVNDLSPDPEPSTWQSWCRWIRGLTAAYLGDKKTRQDWPDQEQEAAEQIERILDRLANLDEIERRPRPSTFRHTLDLELNASAGRMGRFGEGVLTGRIGDSLGTESDRVILIGMAEGIFPHNPLDDPLLPDRERKAAGDDLALLSDRVDDQHRHLLEALAAARLSTMIYARGDSRSGTEQYPSRWLLDTASARAGRPVDSTSLETLAGAASDWFEHVPSFTGRVIDADFPANDQEFRLQALVQSGRSNSSGSPKPATDAAIDVFADDPIAARGAELVAARASDAFTRFDGNLAGIGTAELLADALSPTSLETWADCPMRYLLRHILRVQTVEQPEELLEISALEKGSLIHEALEEFMQEQLRDGAVPPPNQAWDPQQRVRLQEIGLAKCQAAEAEGLTGAPVYWRHQQRRILADLDRFLHEDNQQRQEHGATPIASELDFGTRQGELAPVPVALPGNREVRFKGRADRVDRSDHSGLVVTDYKTGSANRFRGLDESRRDKDDWDPVERGTRLQLPVYGLAARTHIDNPSAAVMSRYWFVTSNQQFKTCGYVLDDEVLGRFHEVVSAIVEGIEAGVFCDRPDPGATRGPFSQRCEYCNADRLGTEDQRRAWERMQDRAELADYRDLAEPPPPDLDTEGC